MADISLLNTDAFPPDAQAYIHALREHFEKQTHNAALEIAQLKEQIRQLLLEKYGPKSETLSDLQLNLFEQEPTATLDEVAAEAERGPLLADLPEQPDQPCAPANPEKKKRQTNPGRNEFPQHLPRNIEEIACAPDQCKCAQCDSEMPVIGFETSEQLDVVPAKYFVLVTKREKRACTHCKNAGVATAPAPERILEKSLASDQLVIDTVVAKYGDHCPLYRQQAILARDAGVELSRVTMNGWVMQVGKYLIPLVDWMRKELLARNYLQADETPVAVQDRQGQDRGGKPGENHQAYLWQFGDPGTSGAPGPVSHGGTVVFHFDWGRAGKVPQEFLRDFQGMLQCDDYSGYNKLSSKIIRVGCWAHTRRGFVDTVKVDPTNQAAIAFVKQLDRLFEIDREAREANLSIEERAAVRQEKSKPLLEAFYAAIDKTSALPKSKLAKAMHYAVSNRSHLEQFLTHPILELSNNLAERSMRPIGLGRKNWLHIGHRSAGPKVAAIMSIVESCKRLQISVRDYLADVLPGLANRKVAELQNLTPAKWKAARDEQKGAQ